MHPHTMKNIDFSTVLKLADEVEYGPGKIVSKTLSQNKSLSLTLFAFDQGEEISAHESKGDAMIIALDGVGEITIEDRPYTVQKGDCIVMPAGKPHAVLAAERFKMFLIVVFPPPDRII